ncbi:MAG: metallophosphoesterase family protein [Bryobacteraceae bacterium]|nr:metallophosphoesterase family protein [Bryobacteraceae bacterium]
MNRRQMLSASLLALGAKAVPEPLRFGVITDVHHGLMPDAEKRLEAFALECSRCRLDFVVQMGDFCHPKPEARSFLKTWHALHGTRHSVLGNHDMDFGSKAQIMDLLEMPRAFCHRCDRKPENPVSISIRLARTN